MTTTEAEAESNGRPLAAGDFDRAALDKLGIRYILREEFPLAELDDEASRQAWNQARLGDPVDEAHVEEMAAELERGVEFPPIIVYRDDKGRSVTLSGNHHWPIFADSPDRET